jgi:hypothetical protein
MDTPCCVVILASGEGELAAEGTLGTIRRSIMRSSPRSEAGDQRKGSMVELVKDKSRGDLLINGKILETFSFSTHWPQCICPCSHMSLQTMGLK